jgi:hypothetical protein
MPKNNHIKPARKSAGKSYSRPSMRPLPNVKPHQLPRDWDSNDGGKKVSYLTKVDQVILEDKHKSQRAKSGQ